MECVRQLSADPVPQRADRLGRPGCRGECGWSSSMATSASSRVREMAAPRRHLALVCFLHQACDRLQFRRVNGPYKLIMTATGDAKLPYGTLPRLLLAWVCTEAVRTQSRELVLGRSLYDFMRKLGMEDRSGGSRGDRTRLRN